MASKKQGEDGKGADPSDNVVSFPGNNGQSPADRLHEQAEARSLRLLEDFAISPDMPDPKIGSLEALDLPSEWSEATPPRIADVFYCERRATHRLLSWWKGMRESDRRAEPEPGQVLTHLRGIDTDLRNFSIIGRTSQDKELRRSYYLGRYFEDALVAEGANKYDAAFLLGLSYHLAEYIDDQGDFSYHFGKTKDWSGRTMYFRAMAAPLYRSFDSSVAWIFTGAVSSRAAPSAGADQ